jgi:hypothetical protein
MSTVDVLDLYRRGALLLGYLVAVIVIGGVFVIAGIGVGLSSVFSAGSSLLADPMAALSSISVGRLAAGVVLVTIGVLIKLAGIMGIAHKLIADAVVVGVEAATVDGANAATTQTSDGNTATPAEPHTSAVTNDSSNPSEPSTTDPTEKSSESDNPQSDPTDSPSEHTTQSVTATDTKDDGWPDTDTTSTIADSPIATEVSASESEPERQTDSDIPETESQTWSPPDASEFEQAHMDKRSEVQPDDQSEVDDTERESDSDEASEESTAEFGTGSDESGSDAFSPDTDDDPLSDPLDDT